MRYTQAEKMEIIRIVERSALPVAHTLRELGVARSTFYRWYGLYREHGYDGLADRPSCARQFWNRIPENERDHVVDLAKAKYIDSDGLGALIAITKRLADRQGQVRLLRPGPTVTGLLRMSRLDRLFEIVSS